MRRLALSCELHASIIQRKKAKHQRVASNDVYITGKDTKQLKPKECNAIFGDGRGRMAFRSDVYKGFICPIRDIKTRHVDNLKVYNIEVEVDNSYIAESIAVHNCGGRAGSRALELLQCILIGTGKRAKYKDASHAWLYFLARRDANMLRGGDGVPSGSIQRVLAKYGALTREEAGDPLQAGPRSDDLAVNWGGGGLRGDKLTALLKEASDNIVTAQVKVRSAQELADGLAAGGVGLGSDMQGYTMTRDRYGVCQPKGSWAHYHVRSGVRKLPDGRSVFQYDQSWGDNVPDGPLMDGCPGNVFGVEWAVQDRLCRNEDWSVVFAFDLWDLENGVDIPWTF